MSVDPAGFARLTAWVEAIRDRATAVSGSAHHHQRKRLRDAATVGPDSASVDSASVSVPAPMTTITPGDVGDAHMKPRRIRNPFECELLTKSSSKGYFESRYADVPLSMFGCQNLVPWNSTDRDSPLLNKAERKQVIGRLCCYFRLGTSLVVSGVVVEAEPDVLQIAPDKGQHVSIEWVPVQRVYAVPIDLSSVRKLVFETVESMLSAP